MLSENKLVTEVYGSLWLFSVTVLGDTSYLFFSKQVLFIAVPLPHACLYLHEGIELKEPELVTKDPVFTFSHLPFILSGVLCNPLTLSDTHFLP